ncbi:unnamed protein product, partial [marine sediment metagenome]
MISSQQQYKINSSIIFNYLREKGPLSRKQISIDLGISAPVVSKVIEDFINESLVIEKGKVKTKSGKRPIMLEVKGDDIFVIGIDMGKEKLRMALTDFNGSLVERYIGFEMIKNIKNLDKKIANEINFFLKKIKLKKPIKIKDIKGICIGFPASINLCGAVPGFPSIITILPSASPSNCSASSPNKFPTVTSFVPIKETTPSYVPSGLGPTVFVKVINGISALLHTSTAEINASLSPAHRRIAST